MELVLAALMTGACAVIVAVISRSDKRADARSEKDRSVIEQINAKLKTNGSKKEAGELVEMIYDIVKRLDRELTEHKDSPNAHGMQWWDDRHRGWPREAP